MRKQRRLCEDVWVHNLVWDFDARLRDKNLYHMFIIRLIVAKFESKI